LAEQSAEGKDFNAQARCLVSTLGMTFLGEMAGFFIPTGKLADPA
jgi:hypothetical protein